MKILQVLEEIQQSLCSSQLHSKVIKIVAYKLGIAGFLSNILGDIEKVLTMFPSTETKRDYSKTPGTVGRWEQFKVDAAAFKYPTSPIGSDVLLPGTTMIKFTHERDVDIVIGQHLFNFNRIFRDEGKPCRFERSLVGETPVKFLGVPDNLLILGSKVLSFIENKTPNDLPVCRITDNYLFDLLEIYLEDVRQQQSETTGPDGGRTDVRALIDQVYGYISLNNLIYGCVTCYDVTYFLWRPERSTLLISHPVYNYSTSPTLLQALYYFADLVLVKG